MKKRISVAIIFGLILLLPLMTFAVTPVALSSLQVGKLHDKPSWAGGPGGPNGGNGNGNGNGNGDTTTYVLNIEIDYMVDHEPTQEVLDYIDGYYDARGINVTFYVIDDPIVVNSSYADGVNDDEFWALEAAYNDMGDDANGTGDSVFGTDGVYSSNWKWVLFGTTVEGEPEVVGYGWSVSSRRDMLAGNYIFIADQTTDEWANTPELEIGAEATVLMHEMGHSIGIGKLHPLFGERYDPDPGSVMSLLSEANAGLYDIVDGEIIGSWYYSDGYWATRNVEYYEEIVA